MLKLTVVLTNTENNETYELDVVTSDKNVYEPESWDVGVEDVETLSGTNYDPVFDDSFDEFLVALSAAVEEIGLEDDELIDPDDITVIMADEEVVTAE